MRRMSFGLAAGLFIAIGAASAQDAAPLIPPEIAAAMTAADVVILGEIHDNPAHHLEQAARVAWIEPAALVFEMLSPEQAAAARGVALADKAALNAALGWDESAWPDFDLYYPIFASAPPDAAIYGAAVPQDIVRAAVTEGAETLLSGSGEAYLRPVDEAEQAQREALQHIAHCEALPADLLAGMVEAQRLRDAAFARVVVQAHEETGGPVVLITGNGHARTDWGVPAVLGHARPDLDIFALGQIEDGTEPEAPFDEVTSAPPAERPDPCEAFR